MGRNTARWQPWPVVVSVSVAVALFATYLAPGTASLWHALDVRTAFALNSLVANNHAQQLLWSFGNLPIFDYLVGTIMLAVLAHYVVFGPRYTAAVRAAQSIVIWVMLVALDMIMRNLIFKGLQHNSPSLVLHPFTLLSHTNTLGAKDASHTSFPGDHAIVAATFAYLVWGFSGRRYGLVALVIAVITCLPRLVAGAHWLTDDVVGGLGTVLVTVPWVVFTPIGPWLVDRLASLLGRATGASNRQDTLVTRR